jgi:enterochelin esterase family protein
VARLFIDSPKLPIRFYLDGGSLELDRSGQGGSILIPNRAFRDVLLSKGYEVHYQQFQGAHDYLSWRGTLADGLILLMGVK